MASLYVGKSHAQIYKTNRPTYSSDMFSAISDVTDKWIDRSNGSTLAVDVGCGSGQATGYLTSMFDLTVGIDPSMAQLEEAKSDKMFGHKADWIVGTSSNLPLKNESCDYMQVFQAAHWFDLPTFYKEVDRALKPGGALVFAVYSYETFLLASDNEEISRSLGPDALESFNNDLSNYNKFLFDSHLMPHLLLEHVGTLFRDLKMPFPNQIRSEHVRMTETWTVDHFVGYLKSWVAWQKISQTGNTSKLDNLETRWKNVFGDRLLVFSWPFAIILSRKPLRNDQFDHVI